MAKIVASGQLTITDLNDSRQVSLYVGSTQPIIVTFDGLSTYSPNYSKDAQSLVPEILVTGGSVNLVSDIVSTKWYVQTGGTGNQVEITTGTAGYTLTAVTTSSKLMKLGITTNVMANQDVMAYICEVVYRDPNNGLETPAKASISIQKRANAVSAYTAYLTNTEATIIADQNGNPRSFANAKTMLTVYKGGKDDTVNWTVAKTPSAGITLATESTTLASVTGMTVDAGTVTFTATHKTESSIDPLTVTFTLTKNRDGQNSSAYWLEAGGAIKRVQDGTTLTPSTITMTGHIQTGSAAPTTYAGRFRVYESVDGVNFGTISYTSSANEKTRTYTISGVKTTKAIKVELYAAGGVTNRLDSQIIPVIEDGVDVLAVSLLTPNGDTIHNSEGAVDVEAFVYKGATDVSATATYVWYLQDSSATIANGKADAAGGEGWLKLTSTNNVGVTGYTTKKIAVPGTAFANIEVVKCLVTHNGSVTGATTVIKDITDPITCQVVGDQFYKNGQGTNTYKAHLYRIGSDGVKNEITNVAGYVFNWSLLNTQLTTVKTLTAKTQSISVPSSDVNGKAIINVDVEAP